MRKYNILTRPIIFILITSLLVGFFSLPIIAYPEEKDSLEYNKVLDENGNWVTQGEYYNTKWENYNCYAFAINRVEEPQFYESGNASRYSPGNICGIGDYNNAKSVSQLAEFARNDLIALGYTNVQILTTIPSVNESEELICLRRKSDGADDTGYHVMQYDYSSNAWYHKPGNSAVLKYTANGGVPSNNDASWYTEMSHTGTMYSDDTCYYNSDIVFIKYSKLQLEAQWCNEVTENINVKAGKDTIYEITVDKSDSYDITLTSQCEELTYNYEIYAYNKFTGYYEVLTSGNGTSGESITESLYFNLINDYYDDVPGWELQAIKYYVRLDFDGENELNSLINVSIEHSHTYNDNYISYSTTQHKAYCECGEYVLKKHDIFDGYCTVCGAAHTTHDYSDHFVHETTSMHKSYCICGGYVISGHVVSNDAFSNGNKFAMCLACGGLAAVGMTLHPTTNDLPRSANGSFILPNGVIVLVSEDIEAYFNGTLEFIYPDDNLETE